MRRTVHDDGGGVHGVGRGRVQGDLRGSALLRTPANPSCASGFFAWSASFCFADERFYFVLRIGQMQYAKFMSISLPFLCQDVFRADCRGCGSGFDCLFEGYPERCMMHL